MRRGEALGLTWPDVNFGTAEIHIKVHDTRRACASLLVALDVHPRVARQILRHTQINITMAVYSEVPSATTRNALKRLGKQLDAQRCCTSPLYRA